MGIEPPVTGVTVSGYKKTFGSLGQLIKIERERLGLTQEELAFHAGVHRNTQAKYEKDESTPDIDYLVEIDKIGGDIYFILKGQRQDFVPLGIAMEGQCVLISEIVEGVENVISASGKALPPDKKGRVVAMLYRAFKASGKVDPAMIEEAVKLSAD